MTKKLFVGGLSWGTKDEQLKAAFETFGAVAEAKVILDNETGRSRGFGFVTFSDDDAGSRAIQEMDGKLFPFGFLKLMRKRKELKKVRLISTNVLPEYQRWGVGVLAVARLVPEVLKTGVREAEFSWVLESNHLSYKTLKRGGAKITKTYRFYDLDLSPPA